MAIINEETNEIHLKILMIGAQGCGKTTNLQSLYKQTAGALATRLFDLHGMSNRNSFFDCYYRFYLFHIERKMVARSFDPFISTLRSH